MFQVDTGVCIVYVYNLDLVHGFIIFLCWFFCCCNNWDVVLSKVTTFTTTTTDQHNAKSKKFIQSVRFFELKRTWFVNLSNKRWKHNCKIALFVCIEAFGYRSLFQFCPRLLFIVFTLELHSSYTSFSGSLKWNGSHITHNWYVENWCELRSIAINKFVYEQRIVRHRITKTQSW